MKLITAILCAAVGLHCAAEEENHSITITPLLKSGFGKMIEIEGRIVDDNDTRLRAHLGKQLIQVERVGSIALPQPVVIELLVFPWANIPIPERGTFVRLRGYETGGFVGIPTEAFKDVDSVACTDHHFNSQFQVTKLLDQAKPQQSGTEQSTPRSKSDSESNAAPTRESK